MKFIKFLGVGGTATAIQYGILVLLVEANLAVPVVASAIGYIISSAANYALNYYFTFSSTARHHVAIAKFIAVASAGLAINSALLYLMTEIASFYYLLAQLVATGAVMLWNFFIHRHWTYASAPGN